MGRPSIEKQNIVSCILIEKKKKIVFWYVSDEKFEKEIYDNSGILEPEIAGFIRYIIFSNHVELKQIFVRPEIRRGGYGRLLIEKLIKLAIKNKKKRIITISGSSKGEVFGDFLIRMGFTEDIHKHWIWEK